ncbi:MAG: hypothetical protein COU29_03285 [Candidatus Magasanikbacteria bacterium CG10_big_fil_rev_8_21_14_0_10_36_32]|uniref:DUF2304 domain-containing protein n=1 Tax=Candidatus Magasanikbacteria bacterium CG10_big_fil_rev_8_21_14_0_10_36_32 TaxID=1974646 RepID=A0A2M6W663_9BACT|nr:MAG: hypothetical protein COU29_03285 [Candidatus Magasanikbacteria bacterium CG10_big_fil_rev_8_21_14_0_10_36_32]
MLAIQLILIALFALIVLKTVFRFRAGDLNWKELIFWLIFWLAAMVIVISPDSTFYLANKLGIGRGADLIVYVALVLLFIMVFGLTVKLEKMNRDITKLTRKNTLNNEEKK